MPKMLPKAVCPSCVEDLRKQGITNFVVEFSPTEARGRWKCNNCWYYVDAGELADLVKLQQDLESHDRARDQILMERLLGGTNAHLAKNRLDRG